MELSEEYLQDSNEVNCAPLIIAVPSPDWPLIQAEEWAKELNNYDTAVNFLLWMKSKHPDVYYTLLILLQEKAHPDVFRTVTERFVEEVQDKEEFDKYDLQVRTLMEMKFRNPETYTDFMLLLATGDMDYWEHRRFCENVLWYLLSEGEWNDCEGKVKRSKDYRREFPDLYYYHLLYLFAVNLPRDRIKGITERLYQMDKRQDFVQMKDYFFIMAVPTSYCFHRLLVKIFKRSDVSHTQHLLQSYQEESYTANLLLSHL